MEYFCFTLHPAASLNEAWEVLEKAHFQLLYASEDVECGKQIFGYPPPGLPQAELLRQYHQVKSFHPVSFDQINWKEQWGIPAEESSLYINLREFAQNQEIGFRMQSGPGFGDLSHPTTQLVLRLMAPIVRGKFVIDLGCGSGVLSFAAAKLGAAAVCGIDIDLGAIFHANRNLELNEELKSLVFFQFPEDPLQIPSDLPAVLVMNMIDEEQEVAWKSMPLLHNIPMECITSGILREKAQQNTYMKRCSARGWVLEESAYEEKWCGYRMRNNPDV